MSSLEADLISMLTIPKCIFCCRDKDCSSSRLSDDSEANAQQLQSQFNEQKAHVGCLLSLRPGIVQRL